MNIVFTLLAAFPIGFLVRQRVSAVALFLAADALLFTFQTVGVLLVWMAGEPGIFGGDHGAFGPAPTTFPLEYSGSEVVSYGMVNLVIVLVGIGLTLLGHRTASRRAARRGVVEVS